MNRMFRIFVMAVMVLSLTVPAVYAADDLAKKFNDVLSKGPAEKFWQVKADDVAAMINAKKTDFLIVDTRPNPGDYKQGHIPGAIQITVQDILKPENLKKLPKDKKVILVCVTGQTQNLPIVPLRVLGYNAFTMAFGMSAWQKGANGAKLMQDAIKGADTKNYPVAK